MKVIIAVLLFLVSTALGAFLYQEPKISDMLKKEIFSLQSGKQTLEVVAYLQPMDLTPYNAIENIDTRAQFLVNDMIKYAELSQESIIAKLKQAKVQYTSFWISNAISIPACPMEILNYLATHPLVTKVLSDKAFKAGLPEPEQVFSAPANASVEWNIEWVTATKVWDEFGKEGQDIVVAVADTGIHYTHPALVKHYRGRQDDGSFNHNYNWWDGIRKPVGSGMGKCKVNATEPCDDQGHGTHCMGTILGATDSHTWGVAPKAKFIGCRNMDRGLGRPSTYINCMQFLMAPTDLNGENPKPELRPHVVSNSWGCPRSELCEPNSLKEAVEATTAAGIMMAIAAGNDGSSCSSANAPPGIYAAAYTVGALGYKTDTIAGFSSRGPVKVDGSNRRKPDICAPGSSIQSSYPPDRYASLSGTSMATPHVAGCVALFWSAAPAYARNLEKTMDIINKNAKPMSSSACGSSGVPNNYYGFGNIQVYNAVKAALKNL